MVVTIRANDKMTKILNFFQEELEKWMSGGGLEMFWLYSGESGRPCVGVRHVHTQARPDEALGLTRGPTEALG